MLGEPSIDNIAARARLKYWRRVMTSGPSMLRALIWNKGRPTEWALQVRKDLETLACQISRHLTPEELSRMAINSTDALWDTVVRELFCEGDGDVVGVVTPLGGVAQVVLHGVQVVEVGVQVRVHQDRGVEEDGESQVGVEREKGEVREKRSCMACGWDEDSRTT